MKHWAKIVIFMMVVVAVIGVASKIYSSNYPWCPWGTCSVSGCGCPYNGYFDMLGDCCYSCFDPGSQETIMCCGADGCHPL